MKFLHVYKISYSQSCFYQQPLILHNSDGCSAPQWWSYAINIFWYHICYNVARWWCPIIVLTDNVHERENTKMSSVETSQLIKLSTNKSFQLHNCETVQPLMMLCISLVRMILAGSVFNQCPYWKHENKTVPCFL